MKQAHLVLSFLFLLVLTAEVKAQKPVNWTEQQLMQPAELAQTINSKKNLPLVISIGPGAIIPGSVDVGMVNNGEGLARLKTTLKPLAKGKKLVIYCGCCPFEHCPNVRPAIALLKEMKFTQYYLLNLSHNIKTDWIEKGYPVSKN